MYRYIGNIRVVSIFIALFVGGFTMGGPKDSLNWFEAQERCGHGLTLETTGVSNREYWTGNYKRLSPWIKILGCYPDSNISNHYPKIFTQMDSISVGDCQEICHKKNLSSFAIKLKKCTCLKGNVNFDSMIKISPTHCNYSCDSDNGVYSKECGGEASHNVFKADQAFGNIEEDKNCMSLECTANHIYNAESCQTDLDKVCQISTSVVENAIGWNKSMERCKISLSPSYLYGDLDLTNASKSCMLLPPGKYAKRWIGIARQIYMMEDKGNTIEEDEKKYIQYCQKCTNGNGCIYVYCTDTIKNEAFCSNRTKPFSNETFTSVSSHQPLSTEQTSPITISSYSSSETQTIKTTSRSHQTTTIYKTFATSGKQHISDETISTPKSMTTNESQMKTHQMKDKEDVIVSALISAILGIVISAIAVALTVVYIRRRNFRRKMNAPEKSPEPDGISSNKNQDVSNQHGDSYFMIEKASSYEFVDGSTKDLESPYNKTEEGEYDHLRNKDLRKKGVDDTYQHAKHVTNKYPSNYDTTVDFQKKGQKNTGSKINKSKHEKPPQLENVSSTYSEVENPSQGAYFLLEKASSYELADHSVLDSESPYNETEEGDYDQLRKKDSRKKDTDDTYHHATFDSNRDMSDYDISNADQTQELESTYDHMHESLNLQRNSDYGYNFIDPNIKHNI